MPVAGVDRRILEDQATFSKIGLWEGCGEVFHQFEITVDGMGVAFGVDAVFVHVLLIIIL